MPWSVCDSKIQGNCEQEICFRWWVTVIKRMCDAYFQYSQVRITLIPSHKNEMQQTWIGANGKVNERDISFVKYVFHEMIQAIVVLMRLAQSQLQQLASHVVNPYTPSMQFSDPFNSKPMQTNQPYQPPTNSHSKSKSSSLSRYCKIFLLILLPSTQVTKSSIDLVTNRAVSVVVSVPTLTCPCSMSFVALWTVSAIRSLVMMIGNRLLQNADTVTFFSTWESFEVLAVEGKMPISFNFSRRRVSCLWRNALSGGRVASLWANCLRDWNKC